MKKSLYLPIKLRNVKGTIIEALIDSGCTGTAIHPNFIKKHQLPTSLKERPVRAWNVDGTINKMGLITQEVPLEFQWSNQEESDPWMHLIASVVDIGPIDLILGYDFLKKYNPLIDWNKNIAITQHYLD